MRRIRHALTALLAAALWAASPAAAQQVAPHRAAYSLSLGEARGEISKIDGALVIDWGEVCEGWTITQRMKFRMTGNESGDVDTDIVFSSFESRDGRDYRFSLRTSRDGEVVEDLRGRASLDPDKGGKAEFTMPENTTLELPPGTMFPTAHSILLLNLAAGGEHQVTRAVFDGATLDGALDVSAIIGNRNAPDAVLSARAPGIGDRPSWMVRMAYFDPTDKAGTPSYETSMRMLDNAVAAEYAFEYPEFSMRAKLERLDALPKPRC
jgi:hypothetical protein